VARERAARDVTGWRRLDFELDAWRESGRRATLWLRDDDACRDSPALRRLLGVARAMEVPAALAAIPAALEATLIDAVAALDIATVLQHGYAHRNHAPPGARKWELGAHRPVDAIIAELQEGFGALERAFGTRFAAVLVPPWNRIDPEVISRLPHAGFHGLSTFGPRTAACPTPGVTRCNTHVDLIAWRHDRAFVGAEPAIDRLVDHLKARREGRVDPSEPTGILTHHREMNDAAWTFLTDLIARTREHGAVAWLDAGTAFGISDVTGVTSVRST
jgi:hypothetical protein